LDTSWASHFLPQIALSSVGIWTPSNTWFLGPTRVHIPNAILIGSAVFAQLTAQSPYILQWAAIVPPQNCPFTWEIWTPI